MDDNNNLKISFDWSKAKTDEEIIELSKSVAALCFIFSRDMSIPGLQSAVVRRAGSDDKLSNTIMSFINKYVFDGDNAPLISPENAFNTKG